MKRIIITIVLALVCSLVVSALGKDEHVLTSSSGNLGLIVTSNGSYTVQVGGVPWFSQGFEAFYQNSSWYISGMGHNSLHLVTVNTGEAFDATLGEYNYIQITWAAGSYPVITEFKVFLSIEAIVFTQSFPNGLPGTSLGNPDHVNTAFPAFSQVANNYYLTYSGTFAYPYLGKWGSGTAPLGMQAGNPILFYNESLSTVMISSLDNFMITENTVSKDLSSAFASGVQGMVKSIPAGFEHSTLLFAGQGINATFQAWGDILLAVYGKERTALDADVVLKYLGYWTDNGGYYWYNPEKGKNYEQTTFDLKAYHDEIGLPINYYQFDSWWYFKENSSEYLSALKLWEPRPDVFPDGFTFVADKIGNPPMILHNRHFSAVNDYINNYTFIVEDVLALPIDENLFLHIMGKAQGWGLQVYEQDWMVTTYTTMAGTQTDVYNSRNWLLAMGNAAQKLGITIQYCMDLPFMVLQSVAIPAVTQIRASTDYQSVTNNWQIGYTGLFLWSVGAVPYKDDFWTTSYQPGCIFANTNCTEPNPEMQALVASLSAGPVGPSDEIGATNKTLVLKTCTATGLLLKPDKPSTPIDQVFLDFFPSEKMLQIWDTFTQFGTYRWHYVFAAALESPFTLEASHIELSGVSSVVYNYYSSSSGFTRISPFDDNHPFNIPAGGTSSTGVIGYTYLVIAPVFSGVDWVLLGELEKFIPVSHQRITQLTIGNGALSGTVVGSVGETVALFFTRASSLSSLSAVYCSITSSSGLATFTCGSGASSCSCSSS